MSQQKQMTAPSSYPAPPNGGDYATTQELANYIHQAMVAIDEQRDHLGLVPSGHRVRSVTGLMHRSGHGVEHDRRVLVELYKKYASFIEGLSMFHKRLFVVQGVPLAGAGAAAEPPGTPPVPQRQYLPAAEYFKAVTASAERRAARSPPGTGQSHVRDGSVVWGVDAQGYAVPRAPSQLAATPHQSLQTQEGQSPPPVLFPPPPAVFQQEHHLRAAPEQERQPATPTLQPERQPTQREMSPSVDVTALLEMMLNTQRESERLREEMRTKHDRSAPKDSLPVWQGRARPPPSLDELTYEAWRERLGTWERVHSGMPGSLKGALLESALQDGCSAQSTRAWQVVRNLLTMGERQGEDSAERMISALDAHFRKPDAIRDFQLYKDARECRRGGRDVRTWLTDWTSKQRAAGMLSLSEDPKELQRVLQRRRTFEFLEAAQLSEAQMRQLMLQLADTAPDDDAGWYSFERVQRLVLSMTHVGDIQGDRGPMKVHVPSMVAGEVDCDDCSALVQGVVSRWAKGAPRRGPTAASGVQPCTHCGKLGHTPDKCWSKYPHLAEIDLKSTKSSETRKAMAKKFLSLRQQGGASAAAAGPQRGDEQEGRGPNVEAGFRQEPAAAGLQPEQSTVPTATNSCSTALGEGAASDAVLPVLAGILGDEKGDMWRETCETLRTAALIDTGARHCVAGQRWVDAYARDVLAGLGLDVQELSLGQPRTYLFGRGEPTPTRRRCRLPWRRSSDQKWSYVDVDVVSGWLPMLFGMDALRANGFVVDLAAGRGWWAAEGPEGTLSAAHAADGEPAPVPAATAAGVSTQAMAFDVGGKTPAATGWHRGLMTINLLGQSTDGSFSGVLATIDDDVLMELALLSGNRATPPVIDEAWVRELHEKTGHVGRDRLIGMVRRALGNEAAQKTEEVLRSTRCEVCERRKPREHGAPVAEREREFNDLLLLDSVLLGQHRGRPVWSVVIVDVATRFVAAGLVRDRTARSAARVFLNEWILRWGKPREAGSDCGGEFCGGAFLEVCEEFGIKKFEFAAYHPDAHGLVERMNRTLQETFMKLNDTFPPATFEDLVTALLTVVNETNNTIVIGGFSAAQRVMGRGSHRLFHTLEDSRTSAREPGVMGVTLRVQAEALEALRKVTSSRRLRKLLTQHRRPDRASPVSYAPGDWVYFRRPVESKGDNPYRGPGQVIGALEHNVYVTFGGQVVSVHPADVLMFSDPAPPTGGAVRNAPSNDGAGSGTPPNGGGEARQPRSEAPGEGADDDASLFDFEESLVMVTPHLGDFLCPALFATDAEEMTAVGLRLEPPPATVELHALCGCDLGICSCGCSSQSLYNCPVDTAVFVGAVATGGVAGRAQAAQRQELTPEELREHRELVRAAKAAELEQITSRGVWGEATSTKPKDNAIVMSSRWVVTFKARPGGKEPVRVKARLVIRGFQDPRVGLRTDSATASATGQRMVLLFAAQRGADVASVDISGAFLQGEEYSAEELRRPIVARVPIGGACVYRPLVKPLYGLKDAPRRWRLRLERVLRELRYYPLQTDPSLFIKVAVQPHGSLPEATTAHASAGAFERRLDERQTDAAQRQLRSQPNATNSDVVAVLSIHVDDLLAAVCGGRVEEELTLIRAALDVGREEVLRRPGDSLRHVGVRIHRTVDGYSVDQDDYAAALDDLDTGDATVADDAPYEDVKAFRARVGQLLWLNQTRPCLAFTVARLASHVMAPTYGAARAAHAAVLEARVSSFALSFCRLDGELQLFVFADASFGRNADGTSQGGYAAVLAPKVPHGASIGDVVHSAAVLLEWSSARIRRVCRSTLGAELLVAGGATDASSWLRSMCLEVGLLQTAAASSIPPDYVISDAKSVTTALDTTNIPRERSLMPDLYRLRQMTSAGEVQLLFVNSGDMVADALTKPAKDSRVACEALARLATTNEVNLPLMQRNSRVSVG
eukprot:gene23106-24922_t